MAKTLILLLTITGGLALLVGMAPDLIVLGYLFLIVPGIILTLMPTVFLYLCVFSAIWFATRKQGEGQAVLFGLAGLAVAALGVPMALNRESETALAELRARELQPRQEIRGAGIVTIEVPKSYGAGGCNELCQLLLFNGQAEQVVVRVESGKEPEAFRISREDCRMDLKPLERMLEPRHLTWSRADGAKAAAQAVKSRIAGGECLVRDELREYRKDLAIRWVDENSESLVGKLKLEARRPWSKGVEVEVNGELAARETVNGVALLSLPLHLEPISKGLGFSGWRWGRKGDRVEESKIDRLAMLRRLTKLDLETPRGLELSSIRRILDAALEDASGSNAAFVLLGDYYRSLREEGFEARDRQRLARLILDDRVMDFSYFTWSEKQRKNVGPEIRDAMLRRLLRLGSKIDDKETRATFTQLVHVAAQMGPGTYAGNVPLLDELVRDARLRQWMPELLQRLADQGKLGAEKLVRVLEDETPEKAREIKGAIAGLCLVATDAREFLPRLRALKGPYTQRHAWRGLLIALGAPPSEFRHINFPDQAAYEEKLRKEARACLTKKPKT
jgi:hypothetical protein